MTTLMDMISEPRMDRRQLIGGMGGILAAFAAANLLNMSEKDNADAAPEFKPLNDPQKKEETTDFPKEQACV